MPKKRIKKTWQFNAEISVYALQFSAIVASGILLKDSVYFSPVLIIEVLALFGTIAIFNYGRI